MKKRGISLIVLVITIIVIIILAVAVILSIANNNPIENAKKAAFQNDIATLKEELDLYIQKQYVDSQGTYKASDLNKSGEDIKDILPDIKDKYIGKIAINGGSLEYTDESNMQEYNWANETLTGENTKYDKAVSSDSKNIQIDNATAGKLENLRIYGNSIQNGTPTPDNPVEIQSVGELVTDTNDSNYGKYKIPVTVTGKNLFDIKECITGTRILDNGDGSITVKSYPSFTGKKLSQLAPNLKVGDEFVFSMETNGYSQIYLNNTSSSYNTYITNKAKYIATQEMLDSDVYLYKQTSAQGGADSIIKNIQIELGTVATNYEPYVKGTTENIYLDEPLRKAGEYTDYIDLKEKKIVRKVERKRLQGTVGLYISTGEIRGFFKYIFYKNWYTLSAAFRCNRLVRVSSPTYLKTQVAFSHGDTSAAVYFSLPETIVTTTDEVKTWLDNNETYFVYPKETPTEEKIELPEISTINGSNNISIGASVNPSKMEVIYGK